MVVTKNQRENASLLANFLLQDFPLVKPNVYF